MKSPGIVSSVLMCHSPIVIPEIAGDQKDVILSSTQAMERAAAAIIASQPDVIVLVSPHTPRFRSSFGVVGSSRLHGSFRDFGFPGIAVDLPVADEAVSELLNQARRLGVDCHKLPNRSLDHGAMVPLYFLAAQGWKGATVVLSLSYSPTIDQCTHFGAVLRESAQACGQRWALVASGDMSHRLIPDAPAGYHPEAHKFDQFIKEKVKLGDLRGVQGVDPVLREIAAEDVVDSLCVAGGALNFNSNGHRFLSYEGPFGVGYLISVLFQENGENS